MAAPARLFALLAAFLSGPAAAAAGDDAPERAPQDEGAALTSERALPTFVWVEKTELAPDAIASEHFSNILFINRCSGGCIIQPGPNDARHNTSSIAGNTTRELSEFAYDDATFDAVIDCVRELYAPYDVEVTTTDPGDSTFHHEAILAGTPSELGLDPNIGGIAPANCEPLNNVISFSFANRTGGDVEDMCWTVAQESAHSYGLPDHVFDCHDPMTYIPGCQRKYFRNKNYECGEFETRSCMCGGATQNSHVELRKTFGDGTPAPPPSVEILAPEAGVEVPDSFGIFVNSSDPRLVDKVEIWFNGTKVSEKKGNDFPNPEPRYSFTAPSWPDGYIDIEVKSYNDLGSEGIASVRVLKGEPCSDASTCLAGQECSDGGCSYPPANRQLGEACEIDQNCVEGGCAENDGQRVCAVTCNPSVQGSCADGFECLAQGACWPVEEAGGCCSVAGGQQRGERLPWAALGLFAAALVLIRRRRA